MRRSTRCPAPTHATVPRRPPTARSDEVGGERRRQEDLTGAGSTSTHPHVSGHFNLPRLLEDGQAVEMIPGVLYFASIAERPPPASSYSPPCVDSRRSSLDAMGSSSHNKHVYTRGRTPGEKRADVSGEAVTGAMRTTVRAVHEPPSRHVSLPHVLQPLQMPGPHRTTGADVSTSFSVTAMDPSATAPQKTRVRSQQRNQPGSVAGRRGDSAASDNGPVESRRASLLSLTDLPPDAVSITSGTATAVKHVVSPSGIPRVITTVGTRARSASAARSFSLKAYLSGHYPHVSYPERPGSGDRHHTDAPLAGAGLSGGGLLKTPQARPQSRAASANTYHGPSHGASVAGGGAGSRRRLDRSVSISVVPQQPIAPSSEAAAAAMRRGAEEREDDLTSPCSSDSGCHNFTNNNGVLFPPMASHLHEALRQPGDAGNGGACLLSPHDGAFYVSVYGDPVFEYRSFFADFGPLDLGCVVRFSRRLAKLLEMSAGFEWHDTDKMVSEMTMGSAAAAAAAAARKKRALSVLEAPSDLSARLSEVVPIVVCTGLETHERANVACLLGCFCVAALRWSASAVQQRLQQQVYPPLLAFRDASSGASSYPLTVTDVVRGMRKASLLGWVDVRTFDVEAYDSAKIHDYTWIVPNKVLAMSSPEDDKPARSAAVYARLLGSLGVTMVVRLNDALYDAQTFWQSGIHHVELEFPDGTAPNDADLKHFLSAVEEAFGETVSGTGAECAAVAPGTAPRASSSTGAVIEVGGTYRGLSPAKTHTPVPPRHRPPPVSAAPRRKKRATPASPSTHAVAPAQAHSSRDKKRGIVAVHCRAGLGRTGTVIAVYMMRHYGFTARESISWVRLCRPGSITGIQQQYLETIERRLTPPARVWTDLQWAASAAGSVGYGGGSRMDASQPAYQLHGAVAMDASRGSGGGGGGVDHSTVTGSSFGATAAAAAAAARRDAGGVSIASDVFGGAAAIDAPPHFAASLVHANSARHNAPTIFHSGVSRPLTLNGADTATAPTPMGGAATGAAGSGGDGRETSLSGLFIRRATPPTYGPESFGALAGATGSSRPGTGAGVGGGASGSNHTSSAVADAVAAEQRYELAEVEALLCDPTFIPHRSILEHLKYPSSYFLALERANPFGTAVALQREFASRRRQQPTVTRAAVEKISYTPTKAAGSVGAASSAGPAAVSGSGSAGRRPMSGSGSAAVVPASLASSAEATGAHQRLGAASVASRGAASSSVGGGVGGTGGSTEAGEAGAHTSATTPRSRPSLRLDTSAVMQAAVARSNAALTSRGGIASRYQAIRSRETHAMHETAAITVPTRLRLNSVQLDGPGNATSSSGGGGGGGGAPTSATAAASGGAPTGLSFREGLYGTRRASASIGDTSLPCATPSASLGGVGIGDGLLESSVLLHGTAPLQAVNSSARSLQTPAAATGYHGNNNTTNGAVASVAVSRQSSMVTPHRLPPSGSAALHTAETPGHGSSGAGQTSTTTLAHAASGAVYSLTNRAASVAALQPTLIAAAISGPIGASASHPFPSSMAPSGSSSAQRKAARLGWGAREVRVAR